MKEPGGMKMNDFKKRHDYATAAKGSPKIERKESETKEKHKEEVGVSELTKTLSSLTEQITKLTEVMKVLGTPPSDDRNDEVKAFETINLTAKDTQHQQSAICEELTNVTKTKESRDAGSNIRKRKVEPKPTQSTLETRRERNIDAYMTNINRHDKGRETKKQNVEHDDRTNPN